MAKRIADVAGTPHPRLRYLVGKDAYVLLWLRRLLPWKSYEKLVARIVKIDA